MAAGETETTIRGGGPSSPVTGLANALEAVATRLDRVASRLAAARGDLPDGLANAVDSRLEQARRRTARARSSEGL